MVVVVLLCWVVGVVVWFFGAIDAHVVPVVVTMVVVKDKGKVWWLMLVL